MDRITFEDIHKNEEIRAYIQIADQALAALGFTEHAFAHCTRTAESAYQLLLQLGYDQRQAELARIAGYIHDIGNVVNRIDHAQSGAVMAFRLLDKMGMDATEVAMIVSAIGNHDESTAFPVNAMAAALILADKSDVRRTRVRNTDPTTFDIHDRVNYAVEKSSLVTDLQRKTITLELALDTSICSVMDYFEIFLTRMLLCRRAAEYLGLAFHLSANGVCLL